jgi:hypothetical protein
MRLFLNLDGLYRILPAFDTLSLSPLSLSPSQHILFFSHANHFKNTHTHKQTLSLHTHIHPFSHAHTRKHTFFMHTRTHASYVINTHTHTHKHTHALSFPNAQIHTHTHTFHLSHTHTLKSVFELVSKKENIFSVPCHPIFPIRETFPIMSQKRE